MDTVRSLCGVESEGPESAWTVGLDRILAILSLHGVRATFFVVGRDAELPEVARRWRSLAEAGHELAVHTWSHPQDWPRVSRGQKQEEIRRTADVIESTSGSRPVGFRAPGWNIDEMTLELLAEEGFRYDSSVFPTTLSPALKAAYGMATRFRLPTLGRLSYLMAPRRTYRPGSPLWRRGTRPMLEIPLSVTPVMRRPVFSTWYLWRGIAGLERDLAALAEDGLNFMFHPADFLDRDEVAPLVAQTPSGTYIPSGLLSAWRTKEPHVTAMVREAAARFRLVPLRERLDDPAA